MSSVTLDQSSVEQLRGSGTRVEVRDPQGNVVGYFRPLPRVYQYGEMPDLSAEELKKRFASKNCLTTEEVLRRLEQS